MNPSVFTFDVTAFRLLFPAFANDITFPDATLTQNWNNATCYVSANNYGDLNGDCRLYALNLMTAHITQLQVIVAAGQTPGVLQSATIDKITVSYDPPPKPDQWQWWLNQTAYGQQLLALLRANAAAGFYYGGLPERSAIRTVYGQFVGSFFGGPLF